MNIVDKNKEIKPVKYTKIFIIQINNLKHTNKSIILKRVKQSKLNDLIFLEYLIFTINLLSKISRTFFIEYMIIG